VRPPTDEKWSRHLAGPFAPEDLWAQGTLLRVWARHWLDQPDRAVLIDGHEPDVAICGAPLESLTRTAAGALAALGVAARDRVLWSCTPSLQSVVWLLGALRLGAVVVPINPSLTSSELSYVVGDLRPSAAVVQRAEQRDWVVQADRGVRANLLEDLCRGPNPTAPATLDAASPHDDALIVYTSGTTGQPKGAVHTHRSLLAGVSALQLAWGWQRDDRLILALPLFHVHGLCAGLFGTLAAGASAVLFERFTPEGVLGAVGQGTMFFGVPTMYHRLAESGRSAELGALRLCVSGSAPLPVELWQRLHREAGVSVLERYGMSETLLTLSNPLRGDRLPGTVGFPLPGADAALAEPDESGVGELLVRGPMVCRGFWNRPDMSLGAEDGGWFRTGDLASVDEDGRFSIRGRLTELIITGGHNVYPAEVEAVLGRHPSVGEVAVVGLASEEWGESVTAFVVGRQGEPDVAALAELAEAALAPYKRPRHYRVVAALPRNDMGKVIRRDLA
jgi:malonyl-CoA/methylmalonyl-CoA synthetase